jgi:D-glycero-D-manno-heptose 1,7-bisphosphate phosphatase
MTANIRQAVVLVGGRGARLGPLTDELPKPMVSIAGAPFLDYLLREIGRYGFDRITLLAGYKAEHIINRYHGETVRNAKIEVLVEPEPMGTAGALRLFAKALDRHFILLNGDTIFPINLLDVDIHLGDAIACLALLRLNGAHRYGTVSCDSAGKVTEFLPSSSGAPGPINGGVYACDRRIIEWIKAVPTSLEADVFTALAAEGLLRGQIYVEDFIDIGVPADLERAQGAIPAMLRRPAVFLDRDGVLIKDTGYPHDPAQTAWIEGAAEAIKILNDAGYYVFVVSNQAGVARGYFSEDQVRAFHRWMADELRLSGAHVDAWEYCPHHPGASVDEYRRDCKRRKPAPGMLLDLMRDWPIDVASSFLVGDQLTDLGAARAAGLAGFLFQGGNLAAFVKARLAGLEHPE